MKKEGTLVLQVVYDETGIPHMNLSSEFDPQQTLQTLEALVALLRKTVPYYSDQYPPIPYLN